MKKGKRKKEKGERQQAIGECPSFSIRLLLSPSPTPPISHSLLPTLRLLTLGTHAEEFQHVIINLELVRLV